MLGAVDFLYNALFSAFRYRVGDFYITISTECYNCFHSCKTYCRRGIVYLAMYFGDRDFRSLKWCMCRSHRGLRRCVRWLLYVHSSFLVLSCTLTLTPIFRIVTLVTITIISTTCGVSDIN
jgi:hypothetical protein